MMSVCPAGVSCHRAPAGGFKSPRGRLALPPPADSAAERAETPSSRPGHPGPRPQPAPRQLQVKPPARSHSHRQQHESEAGLLYLLDVLFYFTAEACVTLPDPLKHCCPFQYCSSDLSAAFLTERRSPDT